MLPLVSINGHITEASTPPASPSSTGTISPLDRGFTLGDGIFETMKVTHGAPWYLGRHLQRLERGANIMGIPYPETTLPNWIGDVVHTVHTQGIHDFALRVTLTRGPIETAGLSVNGVVSPTTSIVAYPAPDIPHTLYANGISARIASARRNDRGFTTMIKTTSYAESLIALKEAQDTGYDETIFLNTYNFVAEASASNVFVCLSGAVVTPAITQGILPGITRAVVLELANAAGLSIAEREVHDEELINADEAFLTSSLRGIVPLVKIGEYALGYGTPGLITRQLMKAYEGASNRT